MSSGGAVRLWDWPVRITHWAFVLLLPALWWTGEEGEMERHRQLGTIMLGLVAFRIVWGFVGSSTARFGHFIKGPGAVLAYVRTLFSKEGPPVVGHNPLGGWSTLILLLLLATQVGIGLFTQDVDGLESGPLAYLVSYETADAARGWHNLVFNVITALVVVHIAAILFYLIVKRDNLVGPMFSGRKDYGTPVNAPVFAPVWRALVLALASGALAWWISKGAPLPV